MMMMSMLRLGLRLGLELWLSTSGRGGCDEGRLRRKRRGGRCHNHAEGPMIEGEREGREAGWKPAGSPLSVCVWTEG